MEQGRGRRGKASRHIMVLVKVVPAYEGTLFYSRMFLKLSLMSTPQMADLASRLRLTSFLHHKNQLKVIAQ